MNKKKNMFYVDLTNEDGSSKGEEEKKVEKNGNKFNSGKRNKPYPVLTMSLKCFYLSRQILEQQLSTPIPPKTDPQIQANSFF